MYLYSIQPFMAFNISTRVKKCAPEQNIRCTLWDIVHLTGLHTHITLFQSHWHFENGSVTLQLDWLFVFN
jgi:hypothetical protein